MSTFNVKRAISASWNIAGFEIVKKASNQEVEPKDVKTILTSTPELSTILPLDQPKLLDKVSYGVFKAFQKQDKALGKWLDSTQVDEIIQALGFVKAFIPTLISDLQAFFKGDFNLFFKEPIARIWNVSSEEVEKLPNLKLVQDIFCVLSSDIPKDADKPILSRIENFVKEEIPIDTDGIQQSVDKLKSIGFDLAEIVITPSKMLQVHQLIEKEAELDNNFSDLFKSCNQDIIKTLEALLNNVILKAIHEKSKPNPVLGLS